MDRLGELGRGLDAEMRRHRVLERRPRAAPVLAPGCGADGGEADVVAAAPVTGDRAERREANLAAVAGDADAVDAGTADDCDAPAVRCPGAQDREGVVAHDGACRPAPGRERSGDLLLLARVVHAREQERAHRGGRVRHRDARTPAGIPEQPVEHPQAPVAAEVVRRALGAANEGEQLAVGAEEREVRLRVAAVDREDEGAAHAGAP